MDILFSNISLFTLSLLVSRYSIQRNTNDEVDIVVDSLWIYPVKSCRGIRVDKSIIGARGLQYDREFMVVDSHNKFVSQRSFPKMALITTFIDEEKDCLVLSRLDDPLVPALSIPLHADYSGLPRHQVTIWKDTCDAVDCGEEAARWFNTQLETTSCKLVRMAPEWVRRTSVDYAPNGQNSFSDGFPFLLASIESLADLNARLTKPVDMINFRPNIIIRGVAKPWDEDNWGKFQIHPKRKLTFDGTIKDVAGPQGTYGTDPIEMAIVKPCSRCQVPNIDPNSGVEDTTKEPSKTLKSFHCGKHMNLQSKKFLGEIMFGQNVDHGGVAGGVISTGDSISVMSGRPAWL